MTPRATDVRQRARQARTFARYTTGLRRFLTTPLGAATCRDRVLRQLDTRGESFLALVRDAVFANARSPYLPLFQRADLSFADVVASVRGKGVDGALADLYDAGVYVTLDEFKGRAPISRAGAVRPIAPDAFDNPLLRPVVWARSGGSTGAPRPVQMDFASTEHDAVYTWLFLAAFGAERMTQTMWRPVPPGSAGLGHALGLNKLGIGVDAWFTQTWPDGVRQLPERALLAATVVAANRWGAGIREVVRTSLDDPLPVARWLADRVTEGRPAMLNAPVSSAVRIAHAASVAGLDLDGTLARTGGEPLTAGKAAAIAASGCTVSSSYAMSEVGRIGIGCATAASPDDVHVLTDKLGVMRRPRPSRGDDVWLTTLHPTCRKVLINVDTGDHATLESRACGCLAGELGLTLHATRIGSDAKLTPEGMTFLTVDVADLVERVLPERFGGAAGDYQLVTSDSDDAASLTIVVSPRVGHVDDGAVVGAVMDALARGPSYNRMMSDLVRSGRAVQVARREPYRTEAAKILPVHRAR